MTSPTKSTATEQKTLAALKLATEVAAERHASEWPNEPTPAGFLLDLASVARAVNATGQKRIGEARVLAALKSLERRGLAQSSAVSGMGGDLRMWKVAR